MENTVEQIKVLNLYAGIGGNRKLWENVQVTAVELDPDIASVYANFYPDDEIIVGDAHEYLLKNYYRFDFIWASPPCPSHSRIRKMGVLNNSYPAVYPDIKLWEEITLLKHFAKIPWVIENVKIYYDPIIEVSFVLDRHMFWSNFYVPHKKFKGRGVPHKKLCGSNHVVYGFDISKFKAPDKRRILRNMVNPDVGKYILDCGIGSISKEEQLGLFTQSTLGIV